MNFVDVLLVLLLAAAAIASILSLKRNKGRAQAAGLGLSVKNGKAFIALPVSFTVCGPFPQRISRRIPRMRSAGKTPPPET